MKNVTAQTNEAMARRIHPSVWMDIKLGKRRLVKVSIVAISSIVANDVAAMGMYMTLIAAAATTACHGGEADLLANVFCWMELPPFRGADAAAVVFAMTSFGSTWL